MDNIILRTNIIIEAIDEQIKEIQKELKEKVSSDAYVFERLLKVLTIHGVGFITAVTIIAETQGFDNFTSLRQLWSYAGYYVQQKKSGKYKGKTKISKKGNSHIRRAIYDPAMAIIRLYPQFFSIIFTTLISLISGLEPRSFRFAYQERYRNARSRGIISHRQYKSPAGNQN